VTASPNITACLLFSSDGDNIDRSCSVSHQNALKPSYFCVLAAFACFWVVFSRWGELFGAWVPTGPGRDIHLELSPEEGVFFDIFLLISLIFDVSTMYLRAVKCMPM